MIAGVPFVNYSLTMIRESRVRDSKHQRLETVAGSGHYASIEFQELGGL
jgi:hypothetical protein